MSGGEYGIYNYGQMYLSGSPTVTGGTADIFTDNGFSEIYADDGTAENPTAYSGNAIKLDSYPVHGEIAVHHVTEDTKDKFTFTHEHYKLMFDQEGTALLFQGELQTLTWYDMDGNLLTGDDYPATLPYGSSFESAGLPIGPTVEGKMFAGWLYKKGGDSDWSNGYWPDYSSIRSATAFKADYIDNTLGGGSGTADDPYQIADIADLQELSTILEKNSPGYNNRNVYYQLMEDIDLSGVCGEELGDWTPIGLSNYDSSHAFEANFDGNGKTISNLYIYSSSYYQGLFYHLKGATVKDLTITGLVVARGDFSALAGKITNSTVTNVDVSGVSSKPYGYTTDINQITAYYSEPGDNAWIDVQSYYKGFWIQTTYGNDGYMFTSENLTGAACTASADFINGGRYIKLSYTVTAGSDPIEDGKLAVHADIQIGDNDSAAVEVIQNDAGEVIGLKMVDTHPESEHQSCISRDAQFNLYFDGTGGVTPVDTYWFGVYGDRYDHYYDQLNDDTKSSKYTYEQADGVYTKLSGADSGFAISWQNISLDAGESKTYSFVVGVGETSDPPQWDSENAITLTADVEGNDRLLNVTAKVRDAEGLTDTLYYSADGGEAQALGAVTADGDVQEITGQLDLSDYEAGEYTFSFWVVNSKGAASASVEQKITITEAPHKHAWSEEWSKDDAYHWHECTADGCDVTADSDKDGYEAYTTQYAYNRWLHWQVCTVCGEFDQDRSTEAEHVYDDDQDATCNICGYERDLGSFAISGTVMSEIGDLNCEVRLVQGNTPIATAYPDGNGRYDFYDVAPPAFITWWLFRIPSP